ncbi:D-3-phosphoglycerate dehydrogenase [Rhodnius prolixus]|uniref:D-3-phosphoglycerate dehydrogenase n=1 Tax=Rhodnius prolixus TaxID=13249 RepID=R4FM92_RHOPR
MAIPLKKILVSDAVDNTCVDLLRKYGLEVTCRYKMTKEELIQEIQDYEALIVRSDTKVRADVLAAAHKLRVVGRAGTGVDNIDTEAATRKGVIVLNTPGGNSISACELTCALITSLARNVAAGSQSLKEGRWDRKLYTGEELSGKTLAVLGLGRIGREVATRMSSFGMKVLGFDPLVSYEQAAEFGVQKLELEQIWPQADYITVHTPLIPQTRNLINESSLTKCKKGVKIINVARGGIVDEQALLAALKDGRCGGAGLDVFSEEPPKSEVLRELIEHPKVLATPHLGASTGEAQVRVAVEIAEQFVALSKPDSGYTVTGVVNAPVLSALRNPLNTPWVTLGKRLGSIAAKLASGASFQGLNVEIVTQGPVTENMRFLSTAVLSGMMSSRTANGLNLINAPVLAEEAGLKVVQTHTGNTESQAYVAVRVGSAGVDHVVTGTSRGGESWLLSIDDATFTSGVPLTENTLLFQGTNASSDCTNLIGELVKAGVVITNMAVAVGNAVWISVQTHTPLGKAVDIPNVKAF